LADSCPRGYQGQITLSLPLLPQRPLQTVHRIEFRHRNLRDIIICSRSLIWAPIAQVPVPALRVRSNNTKVFTRTQVLVGNAGWDNDDIAPLNFLGEPLLAPEKNGGRAGVNA
jgi:hypothetical protein